MTTGRGRAAVDTKLFLLTGDFTEYLAGDYDK
jgi:hypothetical protein